MANIVKVTVKAEDKASGKMSRIAKLAKGDLSGSMRGLGKTVLGVAGGFIAAQAAMVGVQSIMSKSIGAAMKYEAQMAEIRALTGATEEDTNLLTDSIMDMAREMPKSPAELGAGAYFILSSGIEDAADAADVLKVAARASTIGLGETKDVSNALTTVLNAYGMSADKAGHVTDVMIQAVKEGKAEASEFAGVLGRVVPLAAQMGISFEEVAANLATFTRLGVSADEAATGLRQVMASLLKPTKQQEEAMEGLGFSAEGLRQQIKDKGLLATLDEMITATGGNEAAVAKLFPNIRALTSVLGTAGVQMEGYKDILGATNSATGNLDEGFKIVADTTQFKVKMAMQKLNLVLMDMGEKALPAVAAGAVEAARAMEKLGDVAGGLWTPFARAIDLMDDYDTKMRELTGLESRASTAFTAAIQERIDALQADREAMLETGKTTVDVAKETAEFDAKIEALATRLGIEEKVLRATGWGTEELRDKTKDLRAEIDRQPATWQVFDAELAKSAMIQAELEGAFGDTGEKAGYLSGAISALTASLKGAASANEELMKTLSDVTGQRTQETNALDIQINALELEQNAALQAEVGQESLGGAVGSTTDALGRQIGALNNLAASMVPQALNDEIAALGRELTVLELGKIQIEAQINARNRLATAQLAMARLANLPAMLELKKLELKREELLAAQSAKTLRLEKEKAALTSKGDLSDAEKARLKAIDAFLAKQKAAIKQIDDEMDALSRGIHIKTLEAEITNLQAEASDKNREAMQRELNKITDQIGATGDLKRQRELYIDTLIPLELLQDIDALGRQKTALDNSKTGAEGARGATKNLSDTIGDQIGKLGLQKEAIDLVTKGWELQAKAMLGLPKMEDIRKQLLAFKALLAMQTMQSILAALGRMDLRRAVELGQLLGRIAAFQPAQHGFHGMVTKPTLFLAGEAGRERVDVTPGGGASGGRTVVVEAHFHGPVLGDRRQAQEFAQWMLPEIERALV